MTDDAAEQIKMVTMSGSVSLKNSNLMGVFLSQNYFAQCHKIIHNF